MSLLSPSLEAFWAVVQKGTVLEAAKMIDLTQTGVTQRIRSLEKQLGVTLFTRSRTGMKLTREGESLLRYVQVARDLEGETLSSLKGKTSLSSVEIHICAPTALMQARIIANLNSVAKKFPQLQLHFDGVDSDDILAKLKSGEAHLGVLPPHLVGRELAAKALKPLRHILVGPSSWKKRPWDDILEKEALIEFAPTKQITLALFKKLKRHSKPPRSRHGANSLESLLSMVQLGYGYTVLSEEYAQPHLKEGSLINLQRPVALEEPLSLAWYPRREMPPYFKSLIETLVAK